MPWPVQLLLWAATAVVVLAILGGAYLALAPRQDAKQAAKTNERLARMIAEMDPLTRGAGLPASLLRHEEVSQSFFDQHLQNTPLAARLTRLLERAKSAWTPGHFVGISAVAALGGLILGSVIDPLLGVVAGALGVIGPLWWVHRQIARRQAAIEAQLPEAADMLANSLKAGYSLQAAMQFVGGEMAEPLGPELLRFYDEQRLGMDVRNALMDLASRLESTDARLLVLAVLIQRETGGNLSEILRTIASVIRERLAFRNTLDVLTAESKMSGRVLSGLPVLLFMALSVVNPGYLQPLMASPTGRLALAYGAVSLLIGIVLMRRLSRIPV